MPASKLRRLLASGPPVGDRLRDAVKVSEEWYDREPGLAPFTLRAILRELASLGWDDQQGPPPGAGSPDEFATHVSPALTAVLDALIADPGVTPVAALETLARVYRDYDTQPPQIVSQGP